MMTDGWKGYLFVLSLFSLTAFLLYSNTLDSSFHQDDYTYIVNNPYVQWEELSLKNLKMFLENSTGSPLAFFSIALNYYFCGPGVSGFHIVNTGIHALSAAGIFLFAKMLLSQAQFKGNASITALTAALLWMLSPTQSQTVSYIMQRGTGLAAMFYIYVLYFYLSWRTKEGRKRRIAFTLAFLSAMMAAFSKKEIAYTLPISIGLIELIILRNERIYRLFERKGVVLSTILLTIVVPAVWYLYTIPPDVKPGPWLIYQVETRVLTGARVIVFYIFQLFFPVPSRLSLEHDFRISRGLLDPPSTLFALAFVCILTASAFVFRKRHPLFSFFTLWFLGTLALETFGLRASLVSEQRLYLSGIAFYSLFTVGGCRLFILYRDKGVTKPLLFLLCGIFLFFAADTYRRNSVWKDEYSLWNDVINKNPYMASGYINLGISYLRDEGYDKALSCYLKAGEIEPRQPEVRYGLGVAYFNLKQYDKAVDAFSDLGNMGYARIRNEPPISYYFSQIAKTYYGHFRFKEAIETMDKALIYEPGGPGLKELKENMEKRTVSIEEIMRK